MIKVFLVWNYIYLEFPPFQWYKKTSIYSDVSISKNSAMVIFRLNVASWCATNWYMVTSWYIYIYTVTLPSEWFWFLVVIDKSQDGPQFCCRKSLLKKDIYEVPLHLFDELDIFHKVQKKIFNRHFPL